jgi:hypothetical protein
VDEAVVEEEADERGGDVGVRVVEPAHRGRHDLLGVRARLVVEPEHQPARLRLREGEGEGGRVVLAAVLLVVVEREHSDGPSGIGTEIDGVQEDRDGKDAESSPRQRSGHDLLCSCTDDDDGVSVS